MHKKRRRPVHHPLLVSYLADVMEKLTSQARDREKKCQPWMRQKIGGRSATVPHHTHLL